MVVDEALRATKRGLSLPPLGAALSIYLPPDVITPVILGAVLGWIYNRSVRGKPWGASAERMGVLLASGMVVGESMMAMVLAGLSIVLNSGSPLAVLGDDPTRGHGQAVGAAACAFLLAVLYPWVARLARRGVELLQP